MENCKKLKVEIKSKKFLKKSLKISWKNRKNKKMSLFVFKIDGMHCASCSTRLEKTLIQHDKIDAANVNLSTEKAYVRSQNLTAEQIIKIVAETGFSASVFDNQQNLQNKQNNEKQISEKANLILAAILTLPLILPMFLMFADSHNFELPRFVQAVLASVVEFYCGRKFFIGAFASLKHKSANMDVLVVLGTLVALYFLCLSQFGICKTCRYILKVLR